MDSSEVNAFDEMQSQMNSEPEVTTTEQRIDYLIHQIFKQNAAGGELLAIWKDAMIMTPTVMPGIDNFEAGINEGKKTFIRQILQTIESVENE